jgi:hypothetical protein
MTMPQEKNDGSIASFLAPLLDRSLNTITVRELVTIIEQIVRKLLQSELIQPLSNQAGIEAAPTETPPQLFLETFGSWQDDRLADEIIDNIYADRFSSDKDLSW